MKMIERIRRLKPAVLVQPGSVTRLMSGLLCLGLAGCGEGLSDSDIEGAVNDHLISQKSVEHCLTQAKIKQTNKPDRFVLAEDAFIDWQDIDGLIIGILMSDGYLNVHTGGYPGESPFRFSKPGTPGALYQPKSSDEVWNALKGIRYDGAVAELTDKAKSAGVWQNGTACLKGRWVFGKVLNRTDPAVDKDGKIVSHISVRIKLNFTMTANSPVENRHALELFREKELKAKKYSDGWHFYELKKG